MRIGVFGGAFDPPHRGHVGLVEAVLTRLEMDRLHVLPTALPPHKGAGTWLDFESRAQMVRAAFEHLDPVVVDEREARRSGPSYMYDTVSEIRDECADARLFLIVGGDWATGVASWYRGEDLLRMVTLVVVGRVGARGLPPDAPPGTSTILLDTHVPGISSTEIRAAARDGRFDCVRQMVPGPVLSQLPGFAAARARERFVQSTELLTVYDIARRGRWPHHVARERLDNWIASGAIYAIQTDMGLVAPGFQFRDCEPRPAMRDVIRRLGTGNPWDALMWMTLPAPAFGGRSPAEVLAEAPARLLAYLDPLPPPSGSSHDSVLAVDGAETARQMKEPRGCTVMLPPGPKRSRRSAASAAYAP